LASKSAQKKAGLNQTGFKVFFVTSWSNFPSLVCCFAVVIYAHYSPELTDTIYHHYYKCAADKNVAKKITNGIILL